jgi:hypothetical protein
VITRVRVEASAKTEDTVRDELVGFIEDIRASAQGPAPWQEEQSETQTTKDGWWGYMTIKRKET